MATMNWSRRALVGAGVAAAFFFAAAYAQQAPPAPAAGAAAQGGARGGAAGRGSGSDTNAQLWTAFDADKDGSITRDEMKAAFDAWYAAADIAKSGTITQEQLA